MVVELKRDTTPREVTAQALDYASWVRDLSNESVTQIAEGYLSHQNSPALAAAFEDRFGESLPEVLNEDHSLLVVASVIPTERIEESLPSDLEPWKYVSTSDQDGSGFAGYFTSDAEVEAFLRLFR